MTDQNAPKPSDARRDGVTTDPQSGSGTTAATPITSPSQPAGTRPGTGDAGSERNLNKTKDAASSSETDDQRRSREAKDAETTDKATGVVSRTLEQGDGSKVEVSSVSTEEADKHLDKLKTIPTYENETASLTGVPGNVNLTQDGRLAGDKSVRDERSLEDVYKEMERKSGPNPLPNREGNELLKSSNFAGTAIGVGAMGRIDRDTTMMGREIKEIAKKTTLSKEDQDRLEAIGKRLDETARI